MDAAKKEELFELFPATSIILYIFKQSLKYVFLLTCILSTQLNILLK